MKPNKKTWCPLPWVFQAIRNNGDIRVCCQANASKSKGILKKENGEVFNAKTDNLDEARNAKLMKEVRLDMLEGKNPEPCLRCMKEETAGIVSRRDYEKDNWSSIIDYDKALKLTSISGEINTKEAPAPYYDLRFGNLCNLKCRMCGPTDSNAWYSDQVQVWGSEFKDSHGTVKLIPVGEGKYRPQNNDYSWIDSESFWSQLEDRVQDIRYLQIVGGEPLLIKRQYQILEKIISEADPKKVVIEYNSNITKIPEKAWSLWRHFKNVRIGASIDGFGEVNDYIRFPAVWGDIENNLRRLDEAEGNIQVWIAATIQVYNILHLPEFIKWKLKSNFRRVNSNKSRPLLTTHLLHNPDFLNIKILPPSYKSLVCARFDEFTPWLESWAKENNLPDKQLQLYRNSAKELLSGYATYMNSEDQSHILPKFWTYTRKLDKLRGQDIFRVLPELAHSVSEFIEN